MDKNIPIITLGKYAGCRIDQLPNGYLRWMLTQDFPKLWLDYAKKKLEKSPFSNEAVSVSRHCLDQYSLRFLNRWRKNHRSPDGKLVGLASFVASEASQAWENGRDVSKHRHKDDGKAKEYDSIVWVFAQNPDFPEYLDVITCYAANSN